MTGFINAVFYMVFGTLLDLAVTVPAGYVLSKNQLPGRKVLMIYFMITMYFSGGLIPSFLLVKSLGLYNSRLVLIILGAFSMYNSIENPNELEVQVFPGADGSFTLYEDDGRTNAYEQGACARTAFTWHWQGESELTIAAPQGDTSLIPKGRHYTIIFRATEAAQVTANTPCTVDPLRS